jgi:hypothetical protein
VTILHGLPLWRRDPQTLRTDPRRAGLMVSRISVAQRILSVSPDGPFSMEPKHGRGPHRPSTCRVMTINDMVRPGIR